MKAFILLAFGCVAVAAGSSRRFYQTPTLTAAEENTVQGLHLRTLNELREHMGLSEQFSFQVESYRKTSSGVRRVRLRQLFKGLPIRVATLQASQNENGFYTGAVSGFCPNIRDNFKTTPSKPRWKLMVALAKYVTNRDSDRPVDILKVTKADLQDFTYEKQIHIDPRNGKPNLVYFVSALIDRVVENGAYIRYPRVLFRAKNLKPIAGILPVKRGHDHCDNSAGRTACPNAQGGNEKVRGLAYGPRCDQVCLNAAVKPGNLCVLENDLINVKSLGNSWDRKQAQLVSVNCDAMISDGNNGAFSPAADAFKYAQVFYEVLARWGRLLRSNREPHTLLVRFGSDYPNSFWDGRRTTFGDGSDSVFPYTIREIIGHEMCHAITENFGNLVFDREAESVNEAFSDICGKAISYYLDGASAGWDFARDLIKQDGVALRYFDDPTRDNVTIAQLSDYNPHRNPYVNMGIYTKAFYSIVAQQNVRFRDAFEAFVFANQIYWNEETSFVDGACGVLRAARDLGLNTNAFKTGFWAVGIELGFCSLAGNEDQIISCHRNINGEIRWAQVNQFRRASYTVKSTEYTSIRVTISGAGDYTVYLEDCNGAVFSDRSRVFDINGVTTIAIYSDSFDIIDVKVRFEFE